MTIDSPTRENAALHHSGVDINPFLSLGPPPGALLDLAAGTELGRFRVGEKLGEGSFGEVYQAYDTVDECEVAIKVVRADLPGSAALTSLLKHEKVMYDRIHDNRHVLKINDVFPVRRNGMELLVLSMELADGGSLQDWLTTYRRDLSTRRTLGGAYIRQIGLALAALHETGICHLDVKPSNFLFVRGVLKIADLGAAVLLGAVVPSPASAWEPSESSVQVGAACYRSPESYTAGPGALDERSDIYSLGILIYEILSPKGLPPFQGDEERLRELHTHDPAPALEGATETEARVVRRCLAKDPSQRYQTVRDLLDDLEEATTLRRTEPSKERIEALWADACTNVEQGRFGCARAFCRRLLRLSPDYEDAQEMLVQLDERLEQAGRIYTIIESRMDSHGLDELIKLAMAAAEFYPGHPASCVVLIQLETKACQYRAFMEEGLLALCRSDWEGANDWFQKARSCDPGATPAERAARFAARILEKIEECHELMERSTRPRARQLAADLDEYLLDRRNEAISFLTNLERTGEPGLRMEGGPTKTLGWGPQGPAGGEQEHNLPQGS
jgi:hypothetical protein